MNKFHVQSLLSIRIKDRRGYCNAIRPSRLHFCTITSLRIIKLKLHTGLPCPKCLLRIAFQVKIVKGEAHCYYK